MTDSDVVPDADLVVVLTEEALGDDDAARITALHPDDTLDLPGAGARRHRAQPARRRAGPPQPVRPAGAVDELRRRARPRHRPGRRPAGAVRPRSPPCAPPAPSADGSVTDDDPLPALERAVAEHDAREVVVVTRPHAVEDTFHTDWASRARERLGVPVLHVYAGTTFLG